MLAGGSLRWPRRMSPGELSLFVSGCVWEINRGSVSEKGCSAKATEAEAGRKARAAEGNAGPASFLVSLVEPWRCSVLFTRHTLMPPTAPKMRSIHRPNLLSLFRRNRPASVVRAMPVLLAILAPAPIAAQSNHLLGYDKPADSWMLEALPVGNGAMGAMLFGRTDVERLQFNHDTLWTGSEQDTGHYQAFGDVFVELGHRTVTQYRRELDVDRALFGVRYRSGDTRFSRTAFASHPARVIVYRFTADRPGA